MKWDRGEWHARVAERVAKDYSRPTRAQASSGQQAS
jgi:hypothetical protein